MLIRFSMVCLTLLCLTFPSRVSAQESSSIDRERSSLKESIGTGILRGLYVATPIVHAIDGISTMRVIELGGREINPLMIGSVQNRAALFATKSGVVAAEVFLTHRLGKKHKFGAIAALAALNVGYSMVAAHNFRVARTMQASSPR